MQALVSQSATPLENVPELGDVVIEKLAGAGINTIEALADMTPEQLESIPGIGPKTVEKISIAVNNYFSSLEGGEAAALPSEGEVAAEAGEGPTDAVETADEPEGETGESSESPELATSGQPAVEAGAEGDATGDSSQDEVTVESAPEHAQELSEPAQATEGITEPVVEAGPDADEAEVQTHRQHPGEQDTPPEKQ